jgi:hypothetical protein
LSQDPRYHQFADHLRVCIKSVIDGTRKAWLLLFAGVSLVSLGSAYCHWNPNDQTLVWDRVPMTIGFMGLLALPPSGLVPSWHALEPMGARLKFRGLPGQA